LEDVEWGEFELGELFEIGNTLSFNKDKLTIGVEYDYVTRTSQNQGILQETGFVNKENINQSNTWSLGLLQMDFFYRKRPWYAGQFVRKIIPRIKLEKTTILFFTVLFNKQKKNLLSGLVRDVDKKFLNAKVQLPIENGEINFSFIENFITKLEEEHIRKLEKEHIAELEAYLKATNLKNYILTKEEEKVIEDFERGKIKFNKFRLDDVFDVSSYKKRFDANKISISKVGKPYVVRSSFNNGIKGYINEDEQYLNEGNTISFGQDTATMFYQEKPYFTGDKIKILKPKDNSFNKQNAQFFISAMFKSFSSFSWGSSSFNEKIIKSQPINLPTINSQPNYKLIETFISAIQKLVIKDMVSDTDEKINTTKKVINKK